MKIKNEQFCVTLPNSVTEQPPHKSKPHFSPALLTRTLLTCQNTLTSQGCSLNSFAMKGNLLCPKRLLPQTLERQQLTHIPLCVIRVITIKASSVSYTSLHDEQRLLPLGNGSVLLPTLSASNTIVTACGYVIPVSFSNCVASLLCLAVILIIHYTPYDVQGCSPQPAKPAPLHGRRRRDTPTIERYAILRAYNTRYSEYTMLLNMQRGYPPTTPSIIVAKSGSLIILLFYPYCSRFMGESGTTQATRVVPAQQPRGKGIGKGYRVRVHRICLCLRVRYMFVTIHLSLVNA